MKRINVYGEDFGDVPAIHWTRGRCGIAYQPRCSRKQDQDRFVTTLTTGTGVVGRDMRDAVIFGLEHIGNKMGGLDAAGIIHL